jgi:branched-subunit amino acid transport protein
VSFSDLFAIVLIALAVYLPKAVPLVLLSDRLPAGVRRWLDYVAPAVLAALVAPSIVISDRSVGTPRLEQLAFVAAFVVALRTRRMLPSVASGLAALVAVVLIGGWATAARVGPG